MRVNFQGRADMLDVQSFEQHRWAKKNSLA